MSTQQKVAILAFPQISAFHLAVPCLVFHDAFIGTKPFDVRVCAESPGRFDSASPLGLEVREGLDWLASADIIIIPSWDKLEVSPSRELLDGLCLAQERGAQLVGLCLGAFVLAYAGLLDGRKATTHWAYAEQFRQLFPKVELDPNPLFVEQDSVLTSAGTAAGLDCCLHLLRNQLGNATATEVARLLVAPPYRSGGQKQFIPTVLPEAQVTQVGIRNTIERILADLSAPVTLDSAAEQSAMSRRSFTRRFKALTGISFTQWLINQRLNYSQQLLEEVGLGIARVAELSGFSNEGVYRKQFKLAYGISPKQWRQAFAAKA
ncbi:GlxA family transcriptional regulator [Paraferrimonas sedimenticola]|uniref:AraC family transcriptional regulator n=1 Tax=Paraferrimonas sedimenticola TaxID=375674 RepID=A0AA37RXA5_9GAMM|nr:helix-turn-helix domain-containing protein [Paraferrimonas sedimenticola]GLP97400.1 AraC family transcriptional regulator [Paraferrimonas sedimenticola]